MDIVSAFVIFIGAGIGAVLRWFLGLVFNPIFPTLPLGTLAANILGGLLMGFALGIFAQYETLPPVVRLSLTTGFLGGLTTFSTFSAETSTLLLRAEYRWVAGIVFLHVCGSVLSTLIGIGAMRLVFKT